MSRSSVAALILANLALSPLFGCKQEAPPPQTPDTDSRSMPVATDRPTPNATTTTPPPTPPRSDGSCMTDKDCGPGLHCAMRTDGAHMLPPPGFCHDMSPMPGGRPLFVDDVTHVARTTSGRAWWAKAPAGVDDSAASMPRDARAQLVAQLVTDALAEHASVAAFARTLCELLALGAPAWLIDKTQRALADEIVHARDTLAFATHLGTDIAPGTLSAAVAPFPGAGDADTLAAALLSDVFRGGCIGETLAAHDVAARALTAPLPELRALYTRIAEDEARHAALAYETAQWLVCTFPTLRPVLKREKARLLTSITNEQRALVAPLLAMLG